MSVECTNYVLLGYKLNVDIWFDKSHELEELCDDTCLEVLVSSYGKEYVFIGYVVKSISEETEESFFSIREAWEDENLIIKITEDLTEVFSKLEDTTNHYFDYFLIKHYH